MEPCPDGAVCVTGTVRHVDLEGGCWVVRGDDGATYDPVAGLPAELRVDGLRVHLTARISDDTMSIRQVGQLVDVLALRRLEPA